MRWLFGQLAPYKTKVVYAITALIVGSGSWLLLGQGVKVVVDEGFVANNAAMLNQMMLVVVAIALLGLSLIHI